MRLTATRRAAPVALGLAAALAGTLLVGTAPTPASAATADDPASRFTIAVLPDTQFYSRYAESNFEPDYGTNPFESQTQWLAQHADELNLAFTTHLGDVVDQVGVDGQWQVADEAMSVLEDGGEPYSILAGNHDVLNSNGSHYDDEYDLANEPFLQYFSPERDGEQATFGGADPTGMNRYHVFEAEGQQFLVLALSWRASDATLAWANEVIAEHPTLPVILTSHDIVAPGDDGGPAVTSDYGERLWNELIADNDQIFLTLNGHFHGSSVLQRTNSAGNAVTQVLIDYQMAYEGGNGYLSLYEFDLTNGVMDIATVSPWVAAKSSDQLTSYDVPVLDGPSQRFSIDLAGRFAGFAPDFGPGTGALPSLTERAIDLVSDGFDGVPPSQEVAAGSPEDYVDVEGTLAHWQMAGETGVLDEGARVEDVAGDNDLVRQTIAESGSAAAQPDDVTIADDAYQFSSSGQSVCFDNSDNQAGRYSYLTTAPDAAVNDADLSNGYTIETFVKLDGDWDIDVNAWSKAVVRSGNRSQIEGMPWSQWDYTASPAALGISNLREFQWTEVGDDATKGDKTNWSGEIMVDTWSHVAIVNDPDAAETTMYVNGAPVLRTAQDTMGMSFNEGMPWIIGSDWVDDAATNGWHGCVGETRIVDRPIGADEWLTARPDLATFDVTSSPADEIVPGADAVAQLAGTGTPRATVTVDGFDPSAVVADDGTWSLDVPASLLAEGSNELALTQGFGERRSDAVAVTVLVATGDGPAPTTSEPEPSGTPDPSDSPAPTDAPGGGADSESGNGDGQDGEAGGLTPTDGGLAWPALAAVVLAFTAGGVLLALRRRTARAGRSG
ncbi:MAG: LamG-like jellyroll fold domain-containing protein [Pseudoclavibacter sp.]